MIPVPDLLNRIPFASIMPTGKLVHVALELLSTEMMKGAMAAAFEHSQKRLNPVGMCLAIHILFHRMAHGV